jgi:long-chain acyl-CoA synthetase
MIEFSRLEEDKRRELDALKLDKRLLFIKALNDLHTLALFRAAVLKGGAAGLVAEENLAQLDCRPASNRDHQLYIANDKTLSGPRLVCFTSGSSGMPKGILRHYESWQRTFQLQRRTLNYPLNAGVLIIGDMSNSMHLYGAMEALDRNVVPEILKKFSPQKTVDTCRICNSELVYATPAHINLILTYARKRSIAPLASVQRVLIGGAKLAEKHQEDLQKLFPNARIVEFFGTTETSYITLKGPNAPTGSVGKACEGVEIRVGEGPDRPALPGVEGLLWIKSDMLFEKYIIGDDENTRWSGGYLTVGDQGYLDERGNLFFTARKGAMVVIAGENVFTDHVERSLASSIFTGEVAVVPVDDPMRGCRLVAAVQCEPTQEQIDHVLRDLREEFGPLKAPKRVVHVADWPFLPSGKTNRQILNRRVVELL